jgi:hypothetical protein
VLVLQLVVVFKRVLELGLLGSLVAIFLLRLIRHLEHVLTLAVAEVHTWSLEWWHTVVIGSDSLSRISVILGGLVILVLGLANML